MSIGLLGKKLGMTQIFQDNGKVQAATVIEAGPCYVVQVKNQEKEGYDAIQCGFQKQKASRLNKPQVEAFKKAGVEPFRLLREFRLDKEALSQYKVGDELKVDIFRPGDYIDVTGVSQGKGFQGVMKRWNFRGHPASHGSKIHRAPGSIGASSDPSRVFKGQHMAGQMGSDKTTIQNLKVLEVDSENNLLVVKGSIPGSRGRLVLVKLAKKKKTRGPETPAKEEEPKAAQETAKDSGAKEQKQADKKQPQQQADKKPAQEKPQAKPEAKAETKAQEKSGAKAENQQQAKTEK